VVAVYQRMPAVLNPTAPQQVAVLDRSTVYFNANEFEGSGSFRVVAEVPVRFRPPWLRSSGRVIAVQECGSIRVQRHARLTDMAGADDVQVRKGEEALYYCKLPAWLPACLLCVRA
jgi:hypothetical protein